MSLGGPERDVKFFRDFSSIRKKIFVSLKLGFVDTLFRM